jgi:hypothetical protein
LQENYFLKILQLIIIIGFYWTKTNKETMRDLNGHFKKKDISMDNKHTKNVQQ